MVALNDPQLDFTLDGWHSAIVDAVCASDTARVAAGERSFVRAAIPHELCPPGGPCLTYEDPRRPENTDCQVVVRNLQADEINAGQVEERSDRSVDELLEEIRSGHAAATEAAAGLDDALLGRSLPLGFRPGDATVAELLVMGGPRHDGNHLDQIEAALRA